MDEKGMEKEGGFLDIYPNTEIVQRCRHFFKDRVMLYVLGIKLWMCCLDGSTVCMF